MAGGEVWAELELRVRRIWGFGELPTNPRPPGDSPRPCELEEGGGEA